MTSLFKPPAMEHLADVDTADCEYKEGVVEIEGVVAPSSQGGWPREHYTVHCFNFSVWRFPGQPLVNCELTILRPVDPESDYFSDFPKLSIQRIKVLISKDETRAIFSEISEHAADSNELANVADELAKPVILKTERFGDLTFNRSIEWFEGDVKWNGEFVRINFSADGNKDISASLKVAEILWDEQTKWKKRVEDYAVQELLSLKNDNWLEEEELPLTPDQFQSRMKLLSISLYPEGGFDFWHDDGDMFWGHSIQISGSLSEGLTQADIPG